MKFWISKSLARNFDFKIKQWNSVYNRGRHPLATLGSIGLTFNDDVVMFMHYCKRKAPKIARIIEGMNLKHITSYDSLYNS